MRLVHYGITLTESSHVFASAHGLEAHERHLHARQGADGVPRRVSDVKTIGVATHKNEDKGV